MNKLEINEAANEVHETARSKGWHEDTMTDFEFVKTTCANIHAEVSELWEAARKDQLRKPCDKSDEMVAIGVPPLTCIEEELADIVIRVFDTAERLGVNIGAAIAAKNEFNKRRSYRHGGKLA